jgi:PAS domain S-box-containing protein
LLGGEISGDLIDPISHLTAYFSEVAGIMKDERKTKKRLIEELVALRREIAVLKRTGRGGEKERRAEEELKRKEQQYRTVVEDQTELICRFTVDGTLTFVNEAYCRYFGKKREDLIGKKFTPLIVKEQRGEVMDRIAALSRRRPIETHEQKVLGPDGKGCWQQWTNRAIFDEDGQLIEYQAVGRDITELKQAEEKLQQYSDRLEEMVAERTVELKKSKEYLDSVIEAFEDPVFVKDEKHRWVLLNEAACQMLGRSREALIGKSDYDVLPKDQADEFWRVDDLVFKTGKPNVNEEKITWGDKIRTISTKKSLLVDSSTGKKYIVGIIRDITDRVRAEEELRESTERLQIIFEFAPEAYYLTDTEGRIVESNRAAEEISGYSKDELIGKTVIESQLLPREEIPRAIRLLQTNRRGQATGPVEFTIRRKDGQHLTLEISSYPVTIKGKLLILNIARDITEHRALDRRIEESEEKFRTTFEQVAVGMSHVALDGHFIRVNDKFCNIVGYSRSELLKRRFQDITHPNDLQTNLEFTRQLLNGEISQLTMEKRYIHKDGYPVWVHLTATLIRDRSGQPDYFICVIEDIGVRKWTEEELARSEERLKILFEYAPDSYFSLDVHGRLLDCNRAAEELTGYQKKELYGKSILKSGLPLEEELPKWAVFLEELTHGRSLGPQEFTLVRKSREKLFVEFSAFPVEIEGQLQLLIIARDITERKKQESLHLAKANLMDALRKGTTIDECLRMACHALREAKMYQRAVMTLHNDRREITHLGQVGLDPKMVQRARQGAPPSRALREKMMAERFRISRSIFIPAEANLPLRKTRRHIPQKSRKISDPRLWRPDDELFVPILSREGDVEGYLSVDTPWDGKRPDRQTILVLEDIVDVVARQIHEIQNRLLLKESQETALALMNATTDSAILTDIRGHILALNEAAARRFGKSRGDIIGIDGFTLMPPKLAHSRRKMMRQAVKTKKPIRFQDRRGDIFFDTTMYPIIDVQGRVTRVAVYGRDITEEVKAKKAQLESEKRHWETMELLPTPVFELDPQGNITTTNQAGLDLFGYRQEDIDKGLNVLSLLVPEEKSRVLKNMAKRLRGETFEGHEYTAVHKDGSTFPILILSSPILRDGKPMGLRGLVVDISERRAMENALRESREKYRRLTENMPDAILTTDENGRITYISRATKDLLGYRPEEVVGKLYHAFVRSSDVPVAINYFRQVLRGKSVRALRLDMKRKDRTIVSTELSVTPIRSGGRITGTQGIIRDITERVRAREEIERAGEKYRNIVNLAPDAIITVDLKGTVTSCNRMFLKYYGLTEDDILNRPFWDSPVMNPKHKNKYRKLFQDLLRGGTPKPFELAWTDGKGKTHYTEVRFSFLREGRKKTGLQAILRDITQQRVAHTALEQSQARLSSLLEMAPDSIITMDTEGRITSCNSASLLLGGHTRKNELIGKKFTDLKVFRKTDIDALKQHFAAAIRGESLPPLEFSFQHKDRTMKWGEGRYSLLKEKGRAVGLLAIIRDITGRRRDEEIQKALNRISEAVHTSRDLKQLYETIHQELSAFLKTKNLSISLFDHAHHMFSVEYHVDEKDRFEGRIPAGKTLTAYLMKANRPLLLTAKNIRELKRSGTVKPIGAAPKVWMGVPLRVEGRPMGALVVNDYHSEQAFHEQDLRLLALVSDTIALSIRRKQIETSLEESEKLFHVMAEQSPHMVWVNAFGRIIYANKLCVKILGYRRELLYASDFDFFSLIAPESRDLVRKNLERRKRGKDIPPYECTMLTRRGRQLKVLNITKVISYRDEPAILGILVLME